jgi:tetratricopeptide (TPR) repeat protein
MNSRWAMRALIIAVNVLPLVSLRADFSADLSVASKALADGVPEVAVIRLQSLLGKSGTGDQWQTTARELVKAFLAAQRPSDALSLLDDARLPPNSSSTFWRAQALADLGRWSDALPSYQAVAADNASPFRVEAIFGTSEMLRALGRFDEALQNLMPLLQEKDWQTRAALRSAELLLGRSDILNARRMLDGIEGEGVAERKERRFLRGRLEMAQHRPDRALSIFESLVKKPEGVSHALVLAVLFEIADAHLQLKTPETGDDFLEEFIDQHPNDGSLAQLFAKLDELYRGERKPARSELERWTHEPEQPRRGFAQWYLALIELRAGHRDRARQLLRVMRDSKARVPELAGGLVELATLEVDQRNFDEALATLEEARTWRPKQDLLERINFLSAQTLYAAGRFQPATTAFAELAHSSRSLTNLSLYNASLGWLQLGNVPRFAAAYDELRGLGADSEGQAELRLEEGLLRARQGQPDASEVLKRFIAEFPGNARLSEAWVALAEVAYHARPPRMDEARKFLNRAFESKPTTAAKERGEYLTIWIEDSAADNGDKVIPLANQFLRQHPVSPFTPDVRIKLAETYFLRQDFPNAQTQFELFAQQNPAAPLAEKALFFAAQSAMASMAPHSLDRAIVLFDQVVQLKGDFRWAARNEQAVIERKLGKPQEALLLYDDVLKNDAKPGEKREALCGKGDVFFDLSAVDPKNYESAIAAYDQLAADAIEPGHWHNQALFKKGICLEKKSDRAAALATFYRVVETPIGSDPLPEYFWFYKAGFNAARLLENDSRWDSAAKVYEKLAAAGGTRSEEAKARLNRLRLEHFLWGE